MKPLPRRFYARDTLAVARELLGCVLIHDGPGGRTAGRIVEVEAYQGEDDPACHAAAGRTPRTAPLYGPPGISYVYLIYGMYHCLNAVTRSVGEPSAVLIRSVEPLEGLELMRARRAARRRGRGRAAPADRELASGPGKLCDAFGLTLEHNRLDLTESGLRILAGEPPHEVVWTPRIGVAAGADRVWRCLEAGSPYVSRNRINGIAAAEPRPATV